jgi:hypothetical protein
MNKTHETYLTIPYIYSIQIKQVGSDSNDSDLYLKGAQFESQHWKGWTFIHHSLASPLAIGEYNISY